MNIAGYNINNYIVGDSIIEGDLLVSEGIQNAELTNQLNSLYNQIIINASNIAEEKITRSDTDIILQGQITTNTDNITQEIADRKDADTVLQTQITTNINNITQEIADRKDADTVLQTQITTNINNITQEIADRKDADIVLQNQTTTNTANITQEITERKDADIVLQNQTTTNTDNITQEIADRKDADIVLQTQITTNTNNIVQEIAQEITERKDADNILQTQITTNTANIAQEIIDRESADSNLQNQINELSSGGEAYDDTEIKQLLADETKAREEFDNLIVNDLSTIEQKQNADYKELSDAIASNFVSNSNDHETFTSNITTETTERTNADTSLQNQITTISTNLSTETTERTNADTSLQNQITNIFNPTITYYEVAWKGDRAVDVLSIAYVFTVYKIGSIAYIQYPDFKVTTASGNTGLAGTKAWETTTRITPKPIAKIFFTVMAQVVGSAAHDEQERHPFTLAFDIDGSLRLGRKLNGFTYGTSMTVAGGLFNYIMATYEWAQMGSDIDGKALNDRFGSSVSLSTDGKVMAVGAILNDDNGIDSGHVRIYAWDGSAWVQRGSDIVGKFANDQSGYSVSLSGNGSVVAIGAILNDGAGSNAGHVRVFDWNGSTWTQRGADRNGEASLDQSGFSVSLSSDGKVVAIGAPYNDGNGLDSGHVRVYSWTGSLWSKLGVDLDGELAGDLSGFSVSLSSNGLAVAIGAINNDGKASNAGHVRVYDYVEEIKNPGSFNWIKRGLDIDGEALNDNSGYSVSLSADGNVVAIGAIGNDGTFGVDSGHVRVYAWSGSAWVQRGVDLDGESSNDFSGYNVSLSSDGNVLAIGATQNSDNGLNSGHVRVYVWNGSFWVQRGGDIDGEAISDKSGQNISLSGDGTMVAIGAPFNDGSFTDAGHVRVYKWSPIA
jgi:hypothetical protein